MAHSLGVVISFCSNDYPFLKACIEGVKPFAQDIIIALSDHFFDGTPEDQTLLEQIFAEHPDCRFVLFAFDEEKNIYGTLGSCYWHNIARLVGFYHLSKEIEYVLFLDTDEIIDSHKWMQWLDTFPYRDYAALRLACYWYFRECSLRALTWEDTPLLVQSKALNGDLLMHPCERNGLFKDIEGKKERHVLGADGLPLIHHYSWVRTEAQMMRKVVSWGHNWCRNWKELVKQEFSHPFTGTDFIHGYSYEEVRPFVEIDLEKKPQGALAQSCSRVTRLLTEEIHRIDILLRL